MVSRPASNWRWWVAALLAVGVVALASLAAGHYLWFVVRGRAAAFMLSLGWMALVLGAAGLLAALCMRVFLPRREAPAVRAGSGEREAPTRVLFQPATTWFSIFFIIAAVGTMFLAQRLSDGALFRFRIVTLEAMSRSDDPAELSAFFRQVEKMEQPDDLTRFVQLLPRFFKHPSEEIRRQALGTVATIAHRMNLALFLLTREGQLLGDRWEPEVVSWLGSEVAPHLRQLLAERTTPRPEIIGALARIARSEESDLFLSVLSDPTADDADFIAAAIGLGNLAELAGAKALLAQLPNRKGEARIRLLWALERIGHTLKPDEQLDERDLGPEVAGLIESLAAQFGALEDGSLCAAVLVIDAFQHVAATAPLIALFDSPRGELICPRLEISEPVGPPLVFVPELALRWLLLNALAEIGAGNRELKRWVGEAINREGYSVEVTKGLRQLQASFARNDVDEE